MVDVLQILRTTLRCVLDRGITPEPVGGLILDPGPFTLDTSRRLYDLVRRSASSCCKSWTTVAAELGLSASRKKMD